MALTAEIVTRTISGETDKRLRISDGYYVRRVSELIGDDTWTKIRILMRFSFLTEKANGDYKGYPSWFFGLCTGTDSPPGTLSPQHFAGLESNSNTLRVTTSGAYFARQSHNGTDPIPTVYKGGIKTSGSYIFLSGTISRSAARLPSYYGITFTRNSPTSMSCVWYVKGASSVDDFASALEATADVPGNADNNTSFSLEPDETTYGELDSVCFSFLGDVDSFEISDLAVKRLA